MTDFDYQYETYYIHYEELRALKIVLPLEYDDLFDMPDFLKKTYFPYRDHISLYLREADQRIQGLYEYADVYLQEHCSREQYEEIKSRAGQLQCTWIINDICF